MSGSMSSYRTRRSRSALFAVVALLAVGMSAYGMDLLGPPAEVPPGPAILPFAAEGAGGGAVAVKVRVALLKGQAAGGVAAINAYWGLLNPTPGPTDPTFRVRRRGTRTTAAGRVAGELQGQKTTHDTAAGLTTVLGPDEASIERVFGNALRTATQVIGLGTTPGGRMATWATPQVELLSLEHRPQYYLEPAGPDLYRRVELADKEGYVVTVRPAGWPPQLTVAVEFAKNTLTGGRYDETIRAYVGRPLLVKTVVTPTVPLTAGQRVLLIWEPRADVAAGGDDQLYEDATAAYQEALTKMTPQHPAVAGLRRRVTQVDAMLAGAGGVGAPPWAVGSWKMTIGDDPDSLLMAEVSAAGDIVVHGLDEGDARASAVGLERKPAVDPAGKVQCRFSCEGETITLAGWVHRDGTGAGTARAGHADEVMWTARRVGGPGEAEAVPQPLPAAPATLDQTKARLEQELARLQEALLQGRPEDKEPAQIQRRIQELEAQLTTAQSPRAPAWAVGGWEVAVPNRLEPGAIVVTPHGEISALTGEFIVEGAVGDRIIDPTGATELEVTFAGDAGEFHGRLKPDGTGVGMVGEEGETASGWTARRVGAAKAARGRLGLALNADVLQGYRAGEALNVPIEVFNQYTPDTGKWLGLPDIAAAPGAAATGVAVLLELETQGQRKASEAACLKNLKQLSVACHMYADDHDGQLPTAADPAEFRKQILPYLRNNDALLVCPAAPDEPGYVFNPALAGKSINDVLHPQAAPMIWDAGAPPGGIQPVPGTTTGRHNGGDNVAFVDGSCRRLTAGAIAELATELAGKASAGKRR